jgi:hypothetical protein
VSFPSEKLPKATIRFTTEQKRSVKLLATSLNTTIQDFTMACYNAGYALMGLEPLDPDCPVELPKKKRQIKRGDA